MPRVDLAEAVRLLGEGQLVGLPTETVYGLAARADDADAVAAVFALKGRPSSHPVILHVLDPAPWVVLTEQARVAMRVWWPGPLTLVLQRRPGVLDAVTGGHETVAIRCPAHPLARAVLREVGPFVAPSANRFGHVSPTSAEHVLADFPTLPVLDGGDAWCGVESTILDLSGPRPALLRPGAVTAEGLAAWLGPIGGASRTPAPGTLRSHYAPRARVVPTADVDATLAGLRGRVGVLRATPPAEYAAVLYDRLRAFDAEGVEVIVAEWCADEGIGRAVNDRLRRAAAR